MSTDPRISVAFSGMLNIHKPAGVTSRDVVNDIQRKIRSVAGQRIKCGHAGTLDPMATGVLLVCTGMATRLEPYLHEFPKSYRAGFTLGATSDTDDRTGAVECNTEVVSPTREQVLAALADQTGSIMQRPPAFSALKVAGQRAYQLARSGKSVELAPRPAIVHEVRLNHYDFPLVECKIRCASGTYIRSIARDIGEKLGCGGLMHSLERTEIGPFSLADAVEPGKITALNLFEHLRSPACAFPGVETVFTDDHQRKRLRDGKPVSFPGQTANRIIAADQDHSFLALLERVDLKTDSYRAEINYVPILFSK